MEFLKRVTALSVAVCLSSTGVSMVSAKEINTQSQCATCKNLDEMMQNRSAGPWFGDVSEDFKIYIPSGKENQTTARILSILMTVTAPFIPSKIAQSFLGGTAAFLAMTDDTGYPSRTYYGTINKCYREIEIGGEFSHFETMIIINVYNDKAHKDCIYRDTQIYEGQMMMRLNSNE